MQACSENKQIIQNASSPFLETFDEKLQSHNLLLTRGKTTTLQINVGRLCNLACKHCHLEAGIHSKEIMSEATMAEILEYLDKNRFAVVDITGGAPELNPHVLDLIRKASAFTPRLMIRTNLTALDEEEWQNFIAVCKEAGAVIIASFPSINKAQFESQRGSGSFQKSISALRQLNAIGYGLPDGNLELNLAVNPIGASLPASQTSLGKMFREELKNNWDITFDILFSFNNVPLGRFNEWLNKTDQRDDYMAMLAARFNPCVVDSLMCRTMMAVDWQGYLYDCDFNLSTGSFMGGNKVHISEMEARPAEGCKIVTGNHCYACAAGSGFT